MSDCQRGQEQSINLMNIVIEKLTEEVQHIKDEVRKKSTGVAI